MSDAETRLADTEARLAEAEASLFQMLQNAMEARDVAAQINERFEAHHRTIAILNEVIRALLPETGRDPEAVEKARTMLAAWDDLHKEGAV